MHSFLVLSSIICTVGWRTVSERLPNDGDGHFYGYRMTRLSLLQEDDTNLGIHLDPPSKEKYTFSANVHDMSYSQWGQDRILWPIFQGKKDAFFVESGARDGESDSNTIYFESRGWQGLLVEPGKEYEKIASKNRKAYIFHGAISPSLGSETMLFEDSVDGLSHLNLADKAAKKDQDAIKAAGKEQTGHGNPKSFFKVQAEPLQDLLAAIDPNRKTVDFWSLDIEGSEANVLENTRFDEISVGVLLIEMNKSEEANRRISAVMARNGFKDIGRTLYRYDQDYESKQGYLDHVFINPKYFEDNGLKMPNKVDGLY